MASEWMKTLDASAMTAEALSAYDLILVDFWAAWCGPCRRVGPILDELATEYAGSVNFGKLNIDDHSQAAERFQVMSIPTMILFKKGAEVERVVGLRAKEYIKAAIDRHR